MYAEAASKERAELLYLQAALFIPPFHSCSHSSLALRRTATAPGPLPDPVPTASLAQPKVSLGHPPSVAEQRKQLLLTTSISMNNKPAMLPILAAHSQPMTISTTTTLRGHAAATAAQEASVAQSHPQRLFKNSS